MRPFGSICRPMFAALRAVAVAASLATAGLLFAGVPAFAHAALLGAEPADGALLKTAPEAFVLAFNEPVAPLVLTLIGADGSARHLEDGIDAGEILTVRAPAGMADGPYALSWRVISQDGHPVAGTVVFSIGAPGAGPPPDPADIVDWPVRGLVWLSRVMLSVGLFMGVGGVSYGALVSPLGGTARSLVRGALATGLCAAPLSLGAQGLDALGTGLSGLGRSIVWTTAASTSFGWMAAIAVAAIALALSSTVLVRAGLARVLALLALAGVGLALGASGHASTAAPRWLMRPSVFVHGVMIAFWAGSLIPLGLDLRQGGATSARSLRQFSAIIPWTIAPLVASGLVLAAVQVEHPSALWTTDYGRVLTVKLVLLAVLFGLAAVNRRHLAKRAERGERRARTALRRSIAAEALVVLLILGTVAVWRFTPPPRALAAAEAVPATAHAMSNRLMADIAVTPGRAGAAKISASLMTVDYGPVDAKEVAFVFSNPAAGIEAIRRQAYKPGDGTWRADVDLPVGGQWTVRAEVLIDDFTLDKVTSPIDIRK